MRKKIRQTGGILLAAVMMLCIFSPESRAEELVLSARSAVLISADTGAVIWEKNAGERLSMASTTKIMTALLTLEEAGERSDPAVEITEEMTAVEGSSMGLEPGDRIALTGLAAGMLLASGNDAANAAALYLDGSQEKFARRMNLRAAEIGMKNSHFVTPSGLDDDEHYSTALDMALLTREALKNREFRRLCSSYTLQVSFLAPEKTVTYTNHNKLLRQYEGCIGVKTGYTKKSGRCLVSAAQRDGVTLIAVTLDAPDDWNDHIALLDHGFSLMRAVSFDCRDFFAELPVAGSDRETVPVRGGAGGQLTLPGEDAERITRRVFLPAFVYAPVKAGDRVGRVRYYLDGAELYSVPLFAREDAGLPVSEPAPRGKLRKRTRR